MPKSSYPVALTIAGSDSGGGAGMQADLKTFERFEVFGTCAVTLITAQNTQGVQAVHLLPPELVRQQIDAVLTDFAPAAIKVGALGGPDIIRAVADVLQSYALPTPQDRPIVIDPVMVSKHGHPLLDDDAVALFVDKILPHGMVMTPNMHEAALMASRPCASVDQMMDVAQLLADRFGLTVVVTGGASVSDRCPDAVARPGAGAWLVDGPRVPGRHLHGTGCSYSAALTALLARGVSLDDAVVQARQWVGRAIEHAPDLGSGVGPLLHRAR
jgi:hydroxymethylpyrimidine/phosphomethylpyrimidine kinase